MTPLVLTAIPQLDRCGLIEAAEGADAALILQRLFRSLIAAASLKLLLSLRVHICQNVFRSLIAAASLKPALLNQSLDVSRHDIPQLDRCGLIEASKTTFFIDADIFTIPQLDRCGLIEAGLRLRSTQVAGHGYSAA